MARLWWAPGSQFGRQNFAGAEFREGKFSRRIKQHISKLTVHFPDPPLAAGVPPSETPNVNGNLSLGSAAVGAALSSVPLLRSGLVLEREWHFRRPERPDRSPEQLELEVMS